MKCCCCVSIECLLRLHYVCASTYCFCVECMFNLRSSSYSISVIEMAKLSFLSCIAFLPTTLQSFIVGGSIVMFVIRGFTVTVNM